MTVTAYLQQDESTVELVDGEFLVGRSSSCNLPLDDGLVSRRHARFLLNGDVLTVADLGSRNGTLLNGDAIGPDPVQLKEGDHITIGSHEFTVAFSLGGGERERSRTVTSPGNLPQAMAPDDVTTQASGSALILILTEKALGLGRFTDAERIFKPRVDSLLRAPAENDIEPDSVDRVARAALQLAVGLRSEDWMNVVFDVYRSSTRIPAAAVVEALHDGVRAIGYTELTPIRRCLEELRTVASPSAADKFALQRLQGLEQVIAA